MRGLAPHARLARTTGNGHRSKTVVVFGAGATAACGGPLTNDILHDAIASRSDFARQDHVECLREFLVKKFSLPIAGAPPADRYPPLPLLLSLVDTALDRNEAFGSEWPPERLRDVRAAVEYSIFALLELRLRTIGPHYAYFLGELYRAVPREKVTVLSMNYDLIADNTIAAVLAALPDYRVDIATAAYRDRPKAGTLLKLHGSLNWLYCPNCHRLDLGVTRSGRTAKVLQELYETRAAIRLGERFDRRQAMPCPDCGAEFRPVLITPTHLKDYRNPHIARTWYEAECELREAKRAIFIGYGMPDDDVEVIYLFKRALAGLRAGAITVVEYATGRAGALGANPVGRRYRALFGEGIDWRPDGFEAWTAEAAQRDFEPSARRRRAHA